VPSPSSLGILVALACGSGSDSSFGERLYGRLVMLSVVFFVIQVVDITVGYCSKEWYWDEQFLCDAKCGGGVISLGWWFEVLL